MKIAIIGNGSTAIKKNNGKFIDNCDLVVRIKNFQLKGFEEKIGTKTNWYSSKWFSWFDRNTFEPLPMHFTKDIDAFLFMFFDPSVKLEPQCHRYVDLYAQLQLKNEFPFSDGNLEMHEKYLKYYHLNDKRLIYLIPKDIEELAINELRLSEANYNRLTNKLIEPTVGLRTIFKIQKIYPDAEIFISGFDGFATTWYWDSNHRVNVNHNYLMERLYLNKIIKTKQVTNLDD